MIVTPLIHEFLVQILAESNVLHQLHIDGMTAYVAEREGVDILIVEESVTGGGFAVEPDSLDREHGGSVHDHARRIIDDGTR